MKPLTVEDQVAELTKQLNIEKAKECRAAHELKRSSRILDDSRRVRLQLETQLKSLRNPYRPSNN